MSLKVWLPLVNNLLDSGTYIAGIDSSNTSQVTSGKLGKCYKISSNKSLMSLNWSTSDISYACWIKINKAEVQTVCDTFSYDSTYNSAGGDILGCNSYGGLSLRWSTNNLYSSSKVLSNIYIRPTARCYSADGSSSSYVYYDPGSLYDLSYDTWVHLCMTWNVSTHTIKFYVNSSLIKSDTITVPPVNATNTSITARLDYPSWSGGNGRATSIPICYNDVRIYDECLSDKEIWNIYNGLVLHYPLSSPYIEPSTNLATSLSAGGQTTVANGCVTTSGQNADTYFTINLSESIVAGTTYSVSCDASGLPDNVYWCFPMGWQGNTGYCFYIYNGHNEYTFTANEGTWGTNRLFMDDNNSGTIRASGNITKMWNWQVEKKSHCTPFMGLGGSRAETKVYDTSGYKYDGTVASSTAPQIIADSARNNKSAYFDANTKFLTLNSTPLSSFTTGSVSFWLKANTIGSSGLLPFTGQSTSYYLMASSSWTGAFYNGGVSASGTIVYYIDGVVDNTPPGTDGLWHHYCVTGVNLSSWTALKLNNYSSVWNGSNIYYSDIRFYNTILSSDDVKLLYNAPISVTNNGSLMTQGEIVEE